MASALLDTNLTPLPPEADLFQVSRYFATYNLVSAPVVNKDGQLVGAVRLARRSDGRPVPRRRLPGGEPWLTRSSASSVSC